MKRSNKRRTPSPTARTSAGKHGTRSVASEKLFIQSLWDQRNQHFARDLFTAVELAQRTGFSPVHLARELHRVGAQPVPRLHSRKKFRDRTFMPQLWWLGRGSIPDYLARIDDAWEEYMLQREAQRIARMTLNRQAADGLIAGAFTASKRRS